ncbi:hypothetical protein J4G33_11000 [Actinotalea sp. BY-33]|uniref:SD-repeat containing protein B domain-containing protein n=1 Tax=Actinotalea soli TaxID=2819234 RepID=A0A939LSP4_9CELL|nr:SdrD B-like domain-containing protein [Actinotalea soli]MBO1752330.1 hypothetical protein [Actinotalea soli]
MTRAALLPFSRARRDSRRGAARGLAALLVAVVTMGLATVGVAAPAAADPAARLQLTASGMIPAPGLTGEDGVYTLDSDRARDAQQFALSYTCPADGADGCLGAAFTLGLEDLVLEAWLTPSATSPGAYTVTHLDAGGVEVPAGSGVLADVAAIRIRFADEVAGTAGLVSGTTGNLLLRAVVRPPVGGGEQTGTVVVTPEDETGSGPVAGISVTTTFVPVLSTETAKSWAQGSWLSGQGASTADTASILGTNAGEPTRTLTITEPADPTAVPAGAAAFNLVALTGAEITQWPAGATSLVLTTWADGVEQATSPALADLAEANAWLAALASPRDVTGLRAVFAAPEGAHIATGAAAGLELSTEQWGDDAGSVLARHGTVDFDSGGGPSDSFGVLRIENTARTVATSGITGEAPGTSQDTALAEILDPRPYASSTKRYTAPGSGDALTEVPVGSYAVATITGTNWTRQGVDSLSLVERPAQGDLDANPPALGLGDIDGAMFADSGLVFAGFGDGFVDGDPASGPNGTGLVWPSDAEELELTVTSAAGTATVTLVPGDLLPGLGALTAPQSIGSWAAVTGLTATFVDRGGDPIPTGARASLPYLLTPGADAEPGVYANHVLATTSIGGEVSGVAPRTPDSGNRPVSRADLGVEAPSVGAEITKRIPQGYVSTAPGSTVLAVLQATSVPGNTNPTSLIIEESADASPRWWAVMAPTSIDLQVAAGDEATVSFRDAAGDWNVHGTYTDTTDVALGDTSAWTGLRVEHRRAAGFEGSSRVQALVTFAVRPSPTSGAAVAPGELLVNCAHAVGSVEYGGQVYSDRSGPACDEVEAYDAGAGGPAALVKRIAGDVTEGGRGQLAARLTWGTRGTGHGSVTVTDGNDLTAGDPATGASSSFWDSFDLDAVGRITSGPAAGTGAYDPYLVFDQITAVEYFDTTDASWKPVGAAAVPYAGAAAGPGNDWVVMPRIDLSPAEREVAGGVRLVYSPLSDVERAAVVGALAAQGDWRASLAPSLVTGEVASSVHPARGIVLAVSLRDVSRADGTVINDALEYNVPGEPGRVVNDAEVAGDGTRLGGPVGHVEDRTVDITPAVLAAATTKDWRRAADNSAGGADNSEVRELPLPVDADAPVWPTATLTVTGRNASPVPVDLLTLHEPALTDLDDLVSEGAPFGWFDVTDVVGLTPVGDVPGATGLTVQLHEHVPATDDVVSRQVTRDELLAMSTEQLADVVGITVEYEGRIPRSLTAQVGLELVTQLRAEHRVTGVAPGPGLAIDNQVRAEVRDQRVCVAENDGDDGTTATPDCAMDPASATAQDTLTIADAEVKAFVTKSIDRATVHRDADHDLEVRLDVQSFGNSAAESLELVDADPRFYNAVGLTGARLDALVGGAEEARLEVVLRDEGLTVTTAGEYSGALNWVEADVRSGPGELVLGQDTAGAAWSDVIAVRVTMVDTDGELILSPGTDLGVVVLAGRLRPALLSGGLPSAVGAPADWADESATNPGETVTGRVTNVVTGQAYRTGVTSGTRTEHTDTLEVRAGRAQLSMDKQAAPSGGYAPGDMVDYTITVANGAPVATGADVLGLVVVDHLPADESLDFVDSSTWAVAVSPGPDQLGLPVVTHDTTARTVTFTWPEDARLAPGQTVTIDLSLRLSQQLSTIQVVNQASVTATGRPVSGNSSDPGSASSCAAPSTYDPGTETCTRSSAALVLGGADTFVSQKWVSTGRGAVHTVDPSATCAPRGPGADATWFRFPCSAEVLAGGTIDWKVEVTSLASAPTPRLEIIDMLPTPGDYSPLTTGSRGSAWTPRWDGVLPVLDATSAAHPGAELTVWVTTEPHRAGQTTGSTAFDPVPGTWTEVTADLAPAAAAQVTGFRFVVDLAPGNLWLTGQSLGVEWSMLAPEGGAANGTDAWNSFAFRVQPQGSALPLTSVPLKAGIRYATPTYAVGDRVWLDRDRDGRQGAGEPGVEGVQVLLFREGETEAWAVTTTGADGRYLFDTVPAGSWTIGFVLDEDQAARYRFTQPLQGTDGHTDSDAAVTEAPRVSRTAVFDLGPGAANPFQRPAAPSDGIAADHLDPTRDAGLVELPVRVGDRVWFDTDGDGLQGPGEPGIAGVVLVVRNPDGTQVRDVTGALVGPRTTDANGDYLFEGLPPGRYRVTIDTAASARALAGLSPTRSDAGDDRAIDSSTWRAWSRTLVGGEEDLTLDFGFVVDTSGSDGSPDGGGGTDEEVPGGTGSGDERPGAGAQTEASAPAGRLAWTGPGGMLGLVLTAALLVTAGAVLTARSGVIRGRFR